MNQAVMNACTRIGGQADLAKELDVKPPTVSQWVAGSRPVPLERCVEIERLTGVACEVLRPDQAEFFTYLRSHPMPAGQAVAEEGAHG